MRILSLALDPDLLSQMSNVLQPEEREEQNIYITLSAFPLAEQVRVQDPSKVHLK